MYASNNRMRMAYPEFISLMALLMSITAISIDAMLPALRYMSIDLGLRHENEAQYIVAAVFVGLSIGQLVAGPLADAIGRKHTLFIGMLLYLIGSTICLYSTNMQYMLSGRIIQGLGVSGPYVANVAIIRDRFNGRKMAKAMSLIMMIFIMVPALAPAIGQAVLYISDWRGIFSVYIGYSLLISIWVFFRLEESLATEDRVPFSMANVTHSIGTVLSNRISMFYGLARSLVFAAIVGYITSSAQIFSDLFMITDDFYLYFGALASMLGISSFINSRIVFHLDIRNISSIAIYIMMACSAFFLLLTFTVVIKLWMFMIYAAIIFLCMGFTFGNLNALSMEPMGRVAGTAAAVIGSLSTLVSISVGALIGQLYNQTLVPLVTGLFILSILALILIKFARAAEHKAQ